MRNIENKPRGLASARIEKQDWGGKGEKGKNWKAWKGPSVNLPAEEWSRPNCSNKHFRPRMQFFDTWVTKCELLHLKSIVECAFDHHLCRVTGSLLSCLRSYSQIRFNSDSVYPAVMAREENINGLFKNLWFWLTDKFSRSNGIIFQTASSVGVKRRFSWSSTSGGVTSVQTSTSSDEEAAAGSGGNCQPFF